MSFIQALTLLIGYMYGGEERTDYVADTVIGEWEGWNSRDYSFAAFCVAAGRRRLHEVLNHLFWVLQFYCRSNNF
jgi:hypothetical protein